MNWSDLQGILRAALRRQPGLQTELARRLDLPVNSVTDYVTGGHPIPAGHLDVALEVLGLELDLQGRVREGSLSRHNVTATDPVLAVLSTIEGAVARPVRPGDVFDAMEIQIPDPQLTHLAPEILQYIDLGRACIAYSGDWYPLLTLGAGQLGRAAESALRQYASVHGLATENDRGVAVSMHTLIERLHRRELLDARQVKIWMRWKEFRNGHAHEGPLTLYTLGMVSPLMRTLTRDLLQLFSVRQDRAL